MNAIFGKSLYLYLIIPILFYLNAFRSDKSVRNQTSYGENSFDGALNTNALFNRTGQRISAVSLYDPITYNLNITKYEAQAPIYITEMFASKFLEPLTFSVDYFANFMALSSMFSHVAIWHGEKIYRQFKRLVGATRSGSCRDRDDEDIHNVLMRKYTEVPITVYLAFLIICIILFMAVTTFTAFKLPIWATVLGIFTTIISIIPIGIIKGVTGSDIHLNVLAQVMIGYLIPGRTIEVMTFKSLVTNNATQALVLIRGLKLGHYMKISPWVMVAAQFYGTLIGTLCSVSTAWMVMTVPEWAEKISYQSFSWNPTFYTAFYNSGGLVSYFNI
jgi:OPT family oligopeptide transporter